MSKPVSCSMEKKKIIMFPINHPRLFSNFILCPQYAPEFAAGIKICKLYNKCGFLINLSSATAPVKRNRRPEKHQVQEIIQCFQLLVSYDESKPSCFL